jgi:cardiolipin synthase
LGLPLIIKNVPNILTLSRILLLPLFVTAFIYNKYQYALIIFIAGGITDILDGLIARLTNQTTELGKILDPIADKFFLVTSFILMSKFEILPKWIVIIVISRDLIVITGCILLYFIVNTLKIEPSFLGKTSSALQFVLVGVALININIKEAFTIPDSLLVLVAFFTTISGFQYIYEGMKIANSDSI